MQYVTPRSRQLATRLLGSDGGERTTAGQCAESSGRLLDRLWQGLAEVVGSAGVRALLLRALRVAKPECPFLDERIASGAPGESPGRLLRACLAQHEPDVIRNASVTLFATFASLLTTLIGERLAWRLLENACVATVLPEAKPKEADE